MSESENIGFDRGLIPEQIVGATDSTGQLLFIMKWRNTRKHDLVYAKAAYKKCPGVVIEYFEENLRDLAHETTQGLASRGYHKNSKTCGFDRGHTPSEISEALLVDNALHFWITWIERPGEPELVLASKANSHCPDKVIHFYQKRLLLVDASDGSEQATSDSGDDDDVFNVEKVIRKRRNADDTGWEYLIKWEGYGS